MLRFIGNVIWLLLAGLPLAIGYALFGLVAFILLITIPFGIASFRLAGYALWPFGRTIVPRPGAGAGTMIGNIIWFVVAGLCRIALFVELRSMRGFESRRVHTLP